MSKDQFRILWHSVACHINSGYGKGSRYILTGLAKAGYNIVESCYYGLEPGGAINYNGVLCLPSQLGQFGKDSCIFFGKHFKANLSVLFTDWWAFDWFPKKMPNPVAYTPMDHIDYPEEILNFTKMYWKVISFVPFQQKELKRKGITSNVIEHGVDTSIYNPKEKTVARRISGLPADNFIIGIVGANSDKEGRKGWSQMFKALKMFLANNPDVKDLKVLCHSNPYDPRGMPLHRFVHKQGLDNIVAFPPPMIWNIGLEEERLAALYQSFDVLLHPSMREGFGLCILESMACGTPVIGHDFSSMPDLIGKGKDARGWLCKSLAMIDTPINATTAIPDEYSIEKCISDAYFDSRKRIKYGKKGAKFAKTLDWNKIVTEKWIPFIEQCKEELKPKTLDERRLI